MKSRRVFRTYCLPVRFALMSLLLLVGPRVTGSGVRPVFLLLAALAFCFVAVNIRGERKDGNLAVWWRREYLLLEIAAIAVFFAALDHTMACYVTCAVLATHWTVSVWMSGFWEPVLEQEVDNQISEVEMESLLRAPPAKSLAESLRF